MRTRIGRLLLTVLGGLAEFERELIKARTTEGRERAKRAGVKMGRKPHRRRSSNREIRGRKPLADLSDFWLGHMAQLTQFRRGEIG